MEYGAHDTNDDCLWL